MRAKKYFDRRLLSAISKPSDIKIEALDPVTVGWAAQSLRAQTVSEEIRSKL